MPDTRALILAAALVTGCVHHGHHAGHDHGHDHGADAVTFANKIVRAGDGAEVDNPFHPIRLLLADAESEGSVTVYEFILPPESPGSPPHTHSQEDEYFYVTAGTLDILADGKVQRLGTGDFAALTRGNAHMFWNGSDTETRLIMISTGGTFEEFMGAVAPRLADAKPASPEEAGAVIGALAAEHGIIISMEAMPPEAAPYYGPPPG